MSTPLFSDPSRRIYSASFKTDAIQLVLAGSTPKQVGERLDVDPHLLRRWLRQSAKAMQTQTSASAAKTSGAPANSSPDVAALLEANRALSAALAAREQDVAILKKAISILNPKATI